LPCCPPCYFSHNFGFLTHFSTYCLLLLFTTY
jgi:hypothetical protein